MEDLIYLFTPILIGAIVVGLNQLSRRSKGEGSSIPLVAASWTDSILRRAPSASSLIQKGYDEVSSDSDL